jgi:hypothetical protein
MLVTQSIPVSAAELLPLQPAFVNTHHGAEYAAVRRRWQGIPGIERAASGRLLATWYSGGDNEGPDNYVLLASSEDNGRTWAEPLAVIHHPHPVRAFDPVLWHDPNGALWWSWSQRYGLFDGRAGVCATRCLDSSAPTLQWMKPHECSTAS